MQPFTLPEALIPIRIDNCPSEAAAKTYSLAQWAQANMIEEHSRAVS